MEKITVSGTHPRTALQWETLFALIYNTVDNVPIAKGNSSSLSNVGYEIITPNRLKLGRNNNRSLEGAGFKLDMSGNLTNILERNREIYYDGYRIFVENVHMLDLRPNKWLKTSKRPVVDDVVLFTFKDAGYSQEWIDWRLGKVVTLDGNKATISYSGKGSSSKSQPLHTVQRSIRDICIIHSVGDLVVNNKEHFVALRNDTNAKDQ